MPTAVENRAGREKGRQEEGLRTSALGAATSNCRCLRYMHALHCAAAVPTLALPQPESGTHLLRRKHPLRCSDDIIGC